MVSMREAFESFTTEQQKRLEETMEKHSPEFYDPAADDMTIPFAVKLAEQDIQILQMKAAVDRAGFFFFEHIDGTFSLNRK